MSQELPDKPPGGELLLYQTEDGRTRVQGRFEDGTIWLTQAQIAVLFETTPQNVTQHLKSIYEEAELEEGATCKDYLQFARKVPATSVGNYDIILDHAEDQTRRRQQVLMLDWRAKLNGFLQFNQRQVLPDAGTISRDMADRYALDQFKDFEDRRRIELEAKAGAELAAGFAQLEEQVKKPFSRQTTAKEEINFARLFHICSFVADSPPHRN